MARDFTLETYRQLCQAVLANNFTPLPVKDFLCKKTTTPTVILRHDVDRKPGNALRMAKIEHDLGVRSTYYFRHVPHVFHPDIIQEIASLNHEIGYHYETLSKCRGSIMEAIALFERELEEIRRYVSVTTISMHGSPFSKWDNRDIWKHINLNQFDLTGECYLSVDYTKVIYITDTGRTWHPGRYNVRDHVSGYSPEHLKTTADVIQYLSQSRGKSFSILTHPNRWANSITEWFLEATSDFCINRAKQVLIAIRPSTP